MSYKNFVRFTFRSRTLAGLVQNFVIAGLSLKLLPMSKVAFWVLLGIFKRRKPNFASVLACPWISFDAVITFQVMAVRRLSYGLKVSHLKSQMKS